jgi:glucose/arabinose dehydrogenase
VSSAVHPRVGQPSTSDGARLVTGRVVGVRRRRVQWFELRIGAEVGRHVTAARLLARLRGRVLDVDRRRPAHVVGSTTATASATSGVMLTVRLSVDDTPARRRLRAMRPYLPRPLPSGRPRPGSAVRRRSLVALAAAVVLVACGDREAPRVEGDAPVVDAGAPTDGSDADPGEDDGEDDGAQPDGAATDDDGDEVAPDDAGTDDQPDLGVAVELTPVAELGAPTAGDVGPDGTLYLGDRGGSVHPLTDDGIGPALIDLTGETTTGGERGLLGFAFAADGSELYVSFTDLDGGTVIEAFEVVDGAPDPDARRTVFTLDQPYGNHNGGDIQIGPDGRLYLGLGDGGGGGDPLEAGQDLTTPLGALLRIDPLAAEPYGIPSDNPFLDVDGAAREIVAYGLRNPWRFSFDRETGDLWLADVGQNSWEEVNRVPFEELPGANFGWNLREGTHAYAGPEPDDHVPPVYEYETGGPEGCAITGGFVYRGSAIPELVGAYLYSDYCVGSIRALVVDADGEVVEQGDLGIDGGQVVSFVEDADGELYVLDLGGAVHRIDAA